MCTDSEGRYWGLNIGEKEKEQNKVENIVGELVPLQVRYAYIDLLSN